MERSGRMKLLAAVLLLAVLLTVVPAGVARAADDVVLSDDASDFVLLSEAVPDAILEIRYYSTYNFVGDRIDGYEEPLAFLTKEAAAALRQVSDELVTMGYRLKIFDAYRPQRAVTHFMNWALDSGDTRMKEYFYPELDKDLLFTQNYIAVHSGHSRGSTVDLTLFDMRTEREVDMGGTFDYFGERSHPDYRGVTEEQYANRMLLREVMLKHGFRPLAEEWWHFTLENEPYPDTYFTFPINSSSLTAKEETAAVDYADTRSWAYYGIGEDRDADLFLICPSVDMRDEFNMSMEDEETRAAFLGALNMERGIYEDSARLFAPYYRQAAMKVYSLDRTEWEPYLALAYRDVSDAFAWYLENENQGRPIILAGFSQGADMCYRLLAEYFGDEALYDQLVAVYAIGWPCTEELAAACPQIVPAQSADDVGVVISFDCEAPELRETFINPADQKTFGINPLNWRTDGTVADRSENLGACFTDYSGEIQRETAALCGAYLEVGRGVLKVTDIDAAEYPAIIPGMPEGGYHIYAYQFFFRNLQQNVAQRLAAFQACPATDAAA